MNNSKLDNKNILFLINNLSYGGAQKIQTFLANESINHFKSVHIISIYGEENKFEINKDIQVYMIKKIKKKRLFLLKVINYLNIISKIRKYFKKNNIDLVVSFSSEEVFLTKMASFLKGIKIIGSERYNPLNLSKTKKTMNRIFFSMADSLVLQLESLKDFYKNMKHVFVIPNPMLEAHKHNVVKSIDSNVIFTAAARFEYRKGIDVLIRAFKIFKAKNPEYLLHIYGEGGELDNYKKIIKEENIDDILFFPPQNNVMEKNSSAKFFILPSRDEGIPNILIEAMANGIPSISADCPPGGPKFLSDEGLNVLLFEVNDHNMLAQKMIELEENKKLQKELVINSHNKIKELYPNKIFDLWKRCFLDTLNPESVVKNAKNN